MNTNTKTTHATSIDELFNSVRDEKKQAITLVGIARKGEKLSDEDMQKLAHAIYMSTFVKALNIEYNDSDRNGNNACLNPNMQIMQDVQTYHLPTEQQDSKYALTRLGQPAFWCIKEYFIDTSAYNPTELIPKNMGNIIWRKRQQRPDILETATEYEQQFHKRINEKDTPLKTYMVSNLRNILYGRQSK